MKTIKSEIESVIDYIDFHKNLGTQISFVTKDIHNKRKLLAGGTFINEIKVQLQNALLLCKDIEQ